MSDVQTSEVCTVSRLPIWSIASKLGMLTEEPNGTDVGLTWVVPPNRP
ncbi:hypothetical protein [Arcanobacterium bovis]|nr:hypothetical protein [Arcanobacterium bovis]